MKTIFFTLFLIVIPLLQGCLKKEEKHLQEKSYLSQIDWKYLESLDEDETSMELFYLGIDYFNDLKPKIDKREIPFLIGHIDEKFLSEFRNTIKTNKTVAIASPGGFPEIALKIADIIIEKNINIVIGGICYSACADIILPAAKSLEFYEHPLIGFHGTVISMKFFVSQGQVSPCTALSEQDEFLLLLEDLSYKMNSLYKSTGHNIDFWKEQTKRLGSPVLVNQEFVKNECNPMQQFDYELWFPTSIQLKSMLGLNFEGGVCADSASCFERKIPLLEGLRKKYIVGNNPYIAMLP